ncbi:hypothetical protein SEA_STROSAHL_101 [Gordonia phage Strosahl]|uniref:Uncharacterized protein n=2 Tax=Soupsvirus strosahl TaxID=2560510 RepID=A0A1B3B1C7_9CAUD|nr:hypothetical protein BIZ67_gp009 [Gordonia phage Remus]YP_009596302.1 hypothetical protein FDH03_gp009 [Gordonia phage Strosahl]AOE44704.1 hypothetical protein SEA_REMUS_101 [Gordonia phage Remus]AOE44811.1 hypothetical protein SEA_STROSAHL_101 [Gordonia phage Strosahl]
MYKATLHLEYFHNTPDKNELLVETFEDKSSLQVEAWVARHLGNMLLTWDNGQWISHTESEPGEMSNTFTRADFTPDDDAYTSISKIVVKAWQEG